MQEASVGSDEEQSDDVIDMNFDGERTMKCPSMIEAHELATNCGTYYEGGGIRTSTMIVRLIRSHTLLREEPTGHKVLYAYL